MKLEVKWRKCQGDIWCFFDFLKLEHTTFNSAKGVYIIWSGSTTVKIGTGVIKDELYKDRLDEQMKKFPNKKVTWCVVSPENMEGIHRNLNARLRPQIKVQTTLSAESIEVNLPWT
jgi:hypothetical protein